MNVMSPSRNQDQQEDYDNITFKLGLKSHFGYLFSVNFL